MSTFAFVCRLIYLAVAISAVVASATAVRRLGRDWTKPSPDQP